MTGSSSETARELVAIDHWVLPTTSVQRTLRDAVKSFLDRVRQPNWLQDEDTKADDSLRPLSPRQLARWAPAPDWQAGLDGLSSALDAWRERWAETQPVTFLVAPPFSGVATSLAQICETRGWRLIEPPDANSIHRGDDASQWWAQFDGETPWVLPELGHCWLRTPSGLSLVRRLLGAAAAGELGPGIVGSSSWAWTFWTHLMPELRFAVLTPQAFDHERLGHWLRELGQAGAATDVRFRLTTNASWVIPPTDAGEGRKNQKNSTFLKDLAAWSRGIPEVAWAVWRDALRAQPEDDVEDEEAEAATDGRPVRNRCWVAPWSQLTLPTLPPGESRPLAFVLHALLLHQGLDEKYLHLTTGLSLDDIHISLHSLRRAELITTHARGWFVTARGYPAVRRYLQLEGFAVDGF